MLTGSRSVGSWAKTADSRVPFYCACACRASALGALRCTGSHWTLCVLAAHSGRLGSFAFRARVGWDGVGLDGRGETDLNLRTIAPFGLLEPLMWLLEMNGYPVLG